MWYRWAAWILGEGPFKGKGRRSKPRPAEFPKTIPAGWWVRLAVFLAARGQKTDLYTGIYNQPGLLWRQSDSEDVGRAYRAGFRWGLLQMNADNWATIRNRLKANGMGWGYWFHCRTVGDLRALLSTCRVDGAPMCGINVEYELLTTLTPDVIAREVAASGYQGDICTILLGWQGYVEAGKHYGPPDYRPIGQWPGLLEMFPQDAPALWKPTEKIHDCLGHARALGLKHPMQLMGVYDGSWCGTPQPSWWNRTIVPSHVYTADDLGDRFEGWA